MLLILPKLVAVDKLGFGAGLKIDAINKSLVGRCNRWATITIPNTDTKYTKLAVKIITIYGVVYVSVVIIRTTLNGVYLQKSTERGGIQPFAVLRYAQADLWPGRNYQVFNFVKCIAKQLTTKGIIQINSPDRLAIASEAKYTLTLTVLHGIGGGKLWIWLTSSQCNRDISWRFVVAFRNTANTRISKAASCGYCSTCIISICCREFTVSKFLFGNNCPTDIACINLFVIPLDNLAVSIGRIVPYGNFCAIAG